MLMVVSKALDKALLRRLPVSWQVMLAGLATAMAVADVPVRFAVQRGQRRYHWHSAQFKDCDLATSPQEVLGELVNANMVRVFRQ